VLACARGTALPQLGGRATPPLASVPVGLLRRAGLPVPADAYGRVALGGVRPLHPAAGTALAPSASYPPHPFELALDERAAIEARADPGDWLAITELDPALVASAEPVVEANGTRVTPHARSAQTRLYRCAGCTAPVAWRVALESGELDALDVFLFAAPLD
ncbi:MAG TPA: hypothetical protein VFO79_03000, partial [Xanthomonadales bacterium]|nr:hypothetical protein [Xanthomonadales bacterium]